MLLPPYPSGRRIVLHYPILCGAGVLCAVTTWEFLGTGEILATLFHARNACGHPSHPPEDITIICLESLPGVWSDRTDDGEWDQWRS